MLKAIQTNGEGEFKSLAIYLGQHSFNHRVTCPYAYKNGIVESKNKHIVEMGLTLTHQASLQM